MLLHYAKEDGIGRIYISNPPHGALTHPVFTSRRQLQDFLDDDDIKGVLLQGQDRHFCSGADPESFKELFKDKKTLESDLNQAKELLDIFQYAPVPVVAVIYGCCLGAGLEIALSCHFRFAAKSAMFGFPETEYTLLPGLGGTLLAQKLIGRGKAIELILSGRMIGAEEALELGLVDRMIPAVNVEEEAKHFLDGLVGKHPRVLISCVMQAIHNSARLSREEALLQETKLFCRLAARTKEEGSDNE